MDANKLFRTAMDAIKAEDKERYDAIVRELIYKCCISYNIYISWRSGRTKIKPIYFSKIEEILDREVFQNSQLA